MEGERPRRVFDLTPIKSLFSYSSEGIDASVLRHRAMESDGTVEVNRVFLKSSPDREDQHPAIIRSRRCSASRMS